MKWWNQARRDGQRRTYVVNPPINSIKPEQVNAWIVAISGTLRARPFQLVDVPTISFEVWRDARGFTYRLTVPELQAEHVVSQLRTLVPGTAVTPEYDRPVMDWLTVAELGETASSRTLRLPKPENMSASLLAAMQTVTDDETLLMQWVVSPAASEKPPAEVKPARTAHFGFNLLVGATTADREEINDRRTKLSEPNLMAVLRVAATAENESRARQLVGNVRAVLASASGPHNRFRKRLVSSERVRQRINRAAGMAVVWPAQVAASELTALIGWPFGQPHVAGLPQGQARQLAATADVPREGRVIGTSNFAGAERPLAISVRDSCKHLHVVGPSGTGKTTLLTNLVVQDMARGAGVVLMEPKGDLFEAVLERVPAHRVDDVIIMDVTDTAMPVGFNILAQGNPRRTVEDICKLFEYLYPDMRHGVHARMALHRGLSTLITRKGSTFIDLAPLLGADARVEPEATAWRDEVLTGVTDPALRRAWENFDRLSAGEQRAHVVPIMNRLWQLTERPEICHIIGQSTSSFDLGEVLRENKILLINLADLGEATASLAGTLIMNALWSAVRSGATNPDKPTFLYLDEFQHFVQLPVGVEDLLAKARSFGLSMNLAHQYLGQLSPDLRGGVLANARSKIVFQVAADDARTFAREFGGQVDDHHFMHLGQYEVTARIATGGSVSHPVTAVTHPLRPRTGMAKKVRALSRQRYGRRLEDVKAEIDARHAPSGDESKRKPRLGGQKWE